MLDIFFEKRGAKMLLPLKPKPCQTAAISGKQDFAQRRRKRRRDHQRLLSKLRNIIPRIVQTTPIDPKVTQGSRRAAPQLLHDPKVTSGSRREAPQLPAAPHSPQRRQAQSAEAAAGTRARNGHVPPPDRSHYSQSSLAIWTALVAAPLRIWSPQHQKVMPRAASGFEMSRRTRPTQIRS